MQGSVMGQKGAHVGRGCEGELLMWESVMRGKGPVWGNAARRRSAHVGQHCEVNECPCMAVL